MSILRITDEDRIFFSTRLRNARQKAGLTQEQLAETLGKTQSYVAKYETRERDLEFFEVLAICGALNVELGDLLPAEFKSLVIGKGRE